MANTATLRRRNHRTRRRTSSRGRVPNRRSGTGRTNETPLWLQVSLAGLAGCAVAMMMVVVF